MDKAKVRLIYHDVLFSINKEENPVACDKTDEPGGHCVTGNKPGPDLTVPLLHTLLREYRISATLEE